jgi:hypothetical protein
MPRFRDGGSAFEPQRVGHGPVDHWTRFDGWSDQNVQALSASCKCAACARTSIGSELLVALRLGVASPCISGLMGHLKFRMSLLLALPKPVAEVVADNDAVVAVSALCMCLVARVLGGVTGIFHTSPLFVIVST